MADLRLEKFTDRTESNPSELFRQVEAGTPTHSSKDAALRSYEAELEVLAAKYGTNIAGLLGKAHSSVGKFDADFERALSLSTRINFLKNV